MRAFAILVIVLAIAMLVVGLTACSSAPCKAPLTRDWLGQCSQRGGL